MSAQWKTLMFSLWTTRFYAARLSNNSVLQFTCLRNFHRVSGDLEMRCVGNGTWIGEEPMCEVDFLKDKLTLSLIIITASFLVPVIWLGADFYLWTRKRASARKITLMPVRVGNSRKLGYYEWDNKHMHLKPHRVNLGGLDGSSVDRHHSMSPDHILSPIYLSHISQNIDVDEHFSRSTLFASRRNLDQAVQSRRYLAREGKEQGTHQKSLFTMYGTLGRAIYKDFIVHAPDSHLHSMEFSATDHRSEATTATSAEHRLDDAIH